MAEIPSSAKIVVIGGGIGGSSVAYHLARRGVTDVVLLERSLLSSGTTWHSTGNMETYRPDPLVYDMVRYAAHAYPTLAAETGRDIGWRNVGRVYYTDREDRWAAMRTLPELGRARGIQIDLLDPAGIAARLPIIDPAGLLGGMWVPSDARVNATDAVMAFSSAARAGGVTICQDTMVTGIVLRDGAVRAVATAGGVIDCDIVVVAAGLWSRDLLRGCGLNLPLHALEHQYIITKSLGINRELPLFLSYDDQLYGREEVGGLMIGSLDDEAIALSTAALPQNFSFALLNERWDQFEPYMATAMRRFPIMRSAEIKMLLNGPESFTPDGQMLLGPVAGVSGLFSACGFNSNGIALAPAAGRFVAEWIVDGEPSSDVAPIDVRRFSPLQAEDGYIRERVTEIPGYHCRLHAADADYRTARDVRRTPLHDALRAAGARFASVNGWERALWFAPQAGAALFESVAAEVAAAIETVLVVDRSADAKRLHRQVDVPPDTRTVMLQHLPGGYDQVEALVRLLPVDGGRCLLTAGPDQDTRLAEWLRRAGAGDAADMTSDYALVEFHGPGRHALLDRLQAAQVPSGLMRYGDPINDSTLLLLPAADSVRVWAHLLPEFAAARARPGGHFAQDALRIMRGIPAFPREASPGRRAAELGLLPGPASATALPCTHAARSLVAFSSSMPYVEFGARDIVLCGGEVVGELTSRVRLPGWPETLALALINPTQWRPGPAAASLETVAGGTRWPLAARVAAWP